MHTVWCTYINASKTGKNIKINDNILKIKKKGYLQVCYSYSSRKPIPQGVHVELSGFLCEDVWWASLQDMYSSTAWTSVISAEPKISLRAFLDRGLTNNSDWERMAKVYSKTVHVIFSHISYTEVLFVETYIYLKTVQSLCLHLMVNAPFQRGKEGRGKHFFNVEAGTTWVIYGVFCGLPLLTIERREEKEEEKE